MTATLNPDIQHMTTPTDYRREAFEAWARNRWPTLSDRSFNIDDEGEYKNPSLRIAQWAWHACIDSQAQPLDLLALQRFASAVIQQDVLSAPDLGYVDEYTAKVAVDCGLLTEPVHKYADHHKTPILERADRAAAQATKESGT